MTFQKYLIIPIILLLIFSCSSSSIEQRYNKPSEKLDTLNSSSRFTSDNDELLYQKEFDEQPPEENPADIKNFVKNNNEYQTSPIITERDKVMMEIVRYLNTPYQYGGIDNNGIDCSAFTQNVFLISLNINLPRTASEQFREGENIDNISKLKFGDLVFFNTSKKSYPGHVGIYVGDNLFAHASYSQGVTVSSMENQYFNSRYVGARRNIEISE